MILGVLASAVVEFDYPEHVKRFGQQLSLAE
jgi:hypothetical protein